MKCDEFKECVCEVIDKRLSAEQTAEAIAHAKVCPHCQFEYDALQMTRNIVRKKVHRESIPSDVYYEIATSISQPPPKPWMQRIFGSYFNPAIAFIVVAFFAAGIYSLFTPSTPRAPQDGDIISQSLKNYRAFVAGSFKPSLVGETKNVHDYLEKEVSFDVHVPKMPGCTWCGGVLSNFRGAKVANVVYGLGEKKFIYMYQTDLKEAMEGTTIALPPEAKQELVRTDWYFKDFSDSTTLVLWRYKNTLCAAVSKMDKDQLVALLTEKDVN